MTPAELEAIAGDFAGWLDRRMRERGASTRQVQLRTGIHYAHVSRLRNGTRQPSLATAARLIRALGPR